MARERLSQAGQKLKSAPRPNPIERRTTKFLQEPASVRRAASVIVTAYAIAVVGGGILMRLLDHDEYSSIWVGMWWSIQTVTTVGYGDVTPKHVSGRLVAAFVMLEGLAFLAIITAAITSTFVARAQREWLLHDSMEEEARIESRFDELAARLDRIESTLGELAPPGSDKPGGG